ncbi:pyrimidine/purine nucleoside phosphorylase [Reinekea sp.]|jgi:uncharacterized protein YaiE (UPF0345 family)|uniref:pyrimidine/purine nucleoside phosphorylase n=1 Tax=Reinekea sp. TaxID=1970455 RepID=UPI002A810D2E|nr:pyrimidine/purine nucleoside phosphorylase [Reinekea sp.]
MIKHNQYFSGNVQSLALSGHAKPTTVGVMAVGEYEFGTEAAELMQVMAGELRVMLPGADAWQTFATGSEFHVPADSQFQLKVVIDTAYLCIYG